MGSTYHKQLMERWAKSQHGGQRALRSPVMQQGLPGVPKMSDDPQSKAFAALVSQMAPGLNLPMLGSGQPSVPYENHVMAGGPPVSVQKQHAAKIAAATGVDRGTVEKLTETAPTKASGAPDWDTLGNDEVEWSDLSSIGRYMVGGVGKGLAWLGGQLASVLDDSGDTDQLAKAKDKGEFPTAKTVKGSGGAPQMQPGATFGQSAVPGIPRGRVEAGVSPRR